MCKRYVAAIILFYFYCDVKSDYRCNKILQIKGYPGVIEKAKPILNRPYILPTKALCSVGEKFSNDLFTDPEAWLCKDNIMELMSKNQKLYKISVQKCNIPNHWNAIFCGVPWVMDACVSKLMPYTLRGLARNEPQTHNACSKCSESGYLKGCAKTHGVYKDCEDLTRKVLDMKFALKSCKTCQPNFDITYVPPEIEIPAYVYERDIVKINCSLHSNSSDVYKLALKVKDTTGQWLQVTSIKSNDTKCTVHNLTSSTKKLYATITGVQCTHSGLYSCHAEYIARRLSDKLIWHRKSNSKKMEVIKRMRKSTLRMEDGKCNKDSKSCLPYYNTRKINKNITLTCTMNVSIPVNSSHAFKWNYAMDWGEFSKVKDGTRSGTAPTIPHKFRDKSCGPLKQATARLRFITPQPGKVLTVQCVLVFKHQDVVKEFQASIDICIVDGRKIQRKKDAHDTEPGTEICQKIFDDYTSVKYYLEKVKKELGGSPLDSLWSWKFTKRKQQQICSTSRELFSNIFDDASVMQCTQTVQNFMTEHKVFYYQVIKKCNITDRWADYLNCGKKWVFEKCLGKKMLASLRFLNHEPNIDTCQMCKEVPNMRKCAKKALLCRNLTELLYFWRFSEVSYLECPRQCPDVVANWEPPYYARRPPETHDRAQYGKIALGAFSGICGIFIIFIGVSVYLFQNKKMNNELEGITASKSNFSSNVTFKSLKKGHDDKLPKQVSSRSKSKLSEKSSKRKPRSMK